MPTPADDFLRQYGFQDQGTSPSAPGLQWLTEQGLVNPAPPVIQGPPKPYTEPGTDLNEYDIIKENEQKNQIARFLREAGPRQSLTEQGLRAAGHSLETAAKASLGTTMPALEFALNRLGVKLPDIIKPPEAPIGSTEYLTQLAGELVPQIPTLFVGGGAAKAAAGKAAEEAAPVIAREAEQLAPTLIREAEQLALPLEARGMGGFFKPAPAAGVPEGAEQLGLNLGGRELPTPFSSPTGPPPGTVRVYHGAGGPAGAGAASDWFTTNAERAASFGGQGKAVDIPTDVFEAGQAAARAAGSATSGDVILPPAFVNAARPVELPSVAVDLSTGSQAPVDLNAEMAKILGGGETTGAPAAGEALTSLGKMPPAAEQPVAGSVAQGVETSQGEMTPQELYQNLVDRGVSPAQAQKLMTDTAMAGRFAARLAEQDAAAAAKFEQILQPLKAVPTDVAQGRLEFQRQLRASLEQLGVDPAAAEQLHRTTGEEGFISIGRALSEMGGTDGSSFIQRLKNMAPESLRTPKQWESFIYSLRLSDPRTAMRNLLGNAEALGLEFLTQPVQAGVEALRVPFTGSRQAYFSELPHMLLSLPQAITDGLANAAVVWRASASEEAAAKYSNAQFGGLFGIPGKILQSTDALFRGVGQTVGMHGLAARLALQDGLVGEEMATRMAELMKLPLPTDALELATKYGVPTAERIIQQAEVLRRGAAEVGARATYTDVGPVIQALDKIARDPMTAFARLFPESQLPQNIANSRVGADMIKAVQVALFPFTRVPMVIARRIGLNFSPLGFADALFAHVRGAAQEEVSRKIAQASMGSALITGFYYLALQDKLTGAGPRNPSQRAVWRLTHEPYSVHIGDKWYRYTNLGTLSGLAAMAGTFHDLAVHGDDEKTAAAVLSTLRAPIEASPIDSGLELLNAVNEGDIKKFDQVAQFALPMVPGAARAVGRAIEPGKFAPAGLVETAETQLGAARRNQVAPIVDIAGRQPEQAGSALERVISPFPAKQVNPANPVEQVAAELMRLGLSVGFSKPKEGVKETPQEQAARRMAQQGGLFNRLSQLMTTSWYAGASDEQRKMALQYIIRQPRR